MSGAHTYRVNTYAKANNEIRQGGLPGAWGSPGRNARISGRSYTERKGYSGEPRWVTGEMSAYHINSRNFSSARTCKRMTYRLIAHNAATVPVTLHCILWHCDCDTVCPLPSSDRQKECQANIEARNTKIVFCIKWQRNDILLLRAKKFTNACQG